MNSRYYFNVVSQLQKIVMNIRKINQILWPNYHSNDKKSSASEGWTEDRKEQGLFLEMSAIRNIIAVNNK